jgi:hypothetical protein
MFAITCHDGQRFLVGTSSIVSLRNTADGPVAEVRCPSGHLVEHAFRTGRTQAVAATAAMAACA